MHEKMKTSTEFPPNWNQIRIAFPSVEGGGAIFCYGYTIYNPFNREISADLIYHESVHARQQGSTPDVWWYRYINDINFRLDQEIEAYGEQFAFVCRHIPPEVSKNRIKKTFLEPMARALSGEVYGKLISYNEAESKIRRYAKSITQ